jgi:hypothetical protein
MRWQGGICRSSFCEYNGYRLEIVECGGRSSRRGAGGVTWYRWYVWDQDNKKVASGRTDDYVQAQCATLDAAESNREAK